MPSIAAPSIGLFSVEARIATFGTSSSGSSARNTSKARKQTVPGSTPWPHPIQIAGTSASKQAGFPIPSDLAAAGFYHDPTPDAADRCTHFLADVCVADWREGDDPLDRLERADPNNPWLRIFNSKNAVSKQDGEGWKCDAETLLPNSKGMNEARKGSFGGMWMYDGKKGWKPTSTKLADAGFHFTPTDEDPDNATCVYCSKDLNGWEKGDDPLHEHRKRNPDCAFFTCVLVPSAEPITTGHVLEPNASTTKKGRQVSNTKKRGARARKSSVETEEEADQDVLDAVPVILEDEEPTSPGKGRKGKAAPKKSTRGKKAAEAEAEPAALTLAGVEVEDAEIDEQSNTATPPAPGGRRVASQTRKATRVLSTKGAGKGRGAQSKAADKEQEAEYDEVEQTPIAHSKKGPSIPSPAATPNLADGTVIEYVLVDEDEEEEGPQVIEPVVVKTTKGARKASASTKSGRGKKKVEAQVEVEDIGAAPDPAGEDTGKAEHMLVEVAPTSTKSRAVRKKSVATSKRKVANKTIDAGGAIDHMALEDYDAIENNSAPPVKATRKTTAKARSISSTQSTTFRPRSSSSRKGSTTVLADRTNSASVEQPEEDSEPDELLLSGDATELVTRSSPYRRHAGASSSSSLSETKRIGSSTGRLASSSTASNSRSKASSAADVIFTRQVDEEPLASPMGRLRPFSSPPPSSMPLSPSSDVGYDADAADEAEVDSAAALRAANEDPFALSSDGSRVPAENAALSSEPTTDAPFNIALKPLTELELTEPERELTVETWLDRQMQKVLEDVKKEGSAHIEGLERKMGEARLEIEKVLRAAGKRSRGGDVETRSGRAVKRTR